MNYHPVFSLLTVKIEPATSLFIISRPADDAVVRKYNSLKKYFMVGLGFGWIWGWLGCFGLCGVNFSSFFSIPFIILALLFSLPPSCNSDPGSHSRLFSPPTHYGSCLAFFFARRFHLFLPSSIRVELRIPTLLRGYIVIRT